MDSYFNPDEERDRKARKALLSKAYKSMAVLENAFVHNGSGRYLVLRSTRRNSADALKQAIAANRKASA